MWATVHHDYGCPQNKMSVPPSYAWLSLKKICFAYVKEYAWITLKKNMLDLYILEKYMFFLYYHLLRHPARGWSHFPSGEVAQVAFFRPTVKITVKIKDH